MAKLRPTLSDDLAELERTDPDVRAAAENYDRTLWRFLFRSRMAERRAKEARG